MIQKLIKPFTFEFDTIKLLKMLIDTANEQILFSKNDIAGIISYVDKKMPRNEFLSLLFQDTKRYTKEGYRMDLREFYEDYENN